VTWHPSAGRTGNDVTEQHLARAGQTVEYGR
jgi:hypothetical protein